MTPNPAAPLQVRGLIELGVLVAATLELEEVSPFCHLRVSHQRRSRHPACAVRAVREAGFRRWCGTSAGPDRPSPTTKAPRQRQADGGVGASRHPEGAHQDRAPRFRMVVMSDSEQVPGPNVRRMVSFGDPANRQPTGGGGGGSQGMNGGLGRAVRVPREWSSGSRLADGPTEEE